MKFPIKFNKYTGSYLTLGLILWDTKGMFFSGIPVGLLTLTILFIFWLQKTFTRQESILEETTSFRKDILFLIAIQGIILLISLFYKEYNLLLFDKVTRYTIMLQSSVIVFLIGLCYLIYRSLSGRSIFNVLVGLIIVAVLIQVSCIFCSVVTGIDVTVMLQKACDYFIHFKNPYDARYPDIFNGFYVKYYGTINYMTYWPSVVYISSIFYFIFGDYRYAYIFISIVFALVLYRSRVKDGLNKENTLLYMLLWVSSPVLAFTINRGWIDVFVTLPFFLFLYYLNTRKLILSGLFLGIVLSFKLYYLLLTPFIFIYLITHFGFKRSIYFVAVCAAIFSATIVPFLVFDAHQFYQSTITFYSGMKLARPDSLSWVSYLTRLDLQLISAGTYFSLFSIMVFCIWFMFCDKTITRLIEFSCVALLIFFMCARQAFCNYYLFVLFLFYMGIYFSPYGKGQTDTPKQD